MSQAEILKQYKSLFLPHYNSTRKLNKEKLESEWESYGKSKSSLALRSDLSVEENITRIKEVKRLEEVPYSTERVLVFRKSYSEFNYLNLIIALVNNGYTILNGMNECNKTHVLFKRPEHDIDVEHNKALAKEIASKRIAEELERIKTDYFSVDKIQAYIAKVEKEEAEAEKNAFDLELQNLLNVDLNEEIEEYLNNNDVVIMADLKTIFDVNSDYLKTLLVDKGFRENRKDIDGKKIRCYTKG